MNVSDERVLGVSADRKVADAHGDGRQATSARDAAEALFKPKAQAGSIEGEQPTADLPASAEKPPQRKPRILNASSATHALGGAPEASATPPSTRQRAVRRQRAAKIQPSDYSRIRTLATYGMTREQIAELYEARLSEVASIVGNDRARDGD
jgi:hypothetical protein